MSNTARFTFRITDHNGDTGVQLMTLDDSGLSVDDSAHAMCDGITQQVDIYDTDTDELILSIDGTAWRDLDCADALECFVREVLVGNDDAQDFLDDLAAQFDADTAGLVL